MNMPHRHFPVDGLFNLVLVFTITNNTYEHLYTLPKLFLKNIVPMEICIVKENVYKM